MHNNNNSDANTKFHCSQFVEFGFFPSQIVLLFLLINIYGSFICFVFFRFVSFRFVVYNSILFNLISFTSFYYALLFFPPAVLPSFLPPYRALLHFFPSHPLAGHKISCTEEILVFVVCLFSFCFQHYPKSLIGISVVSLAITFSTSFCQATLLLLWVCTKKEGLLGRKYYYTCLTKGFLKLLNLVRLNNSHFICKLHFIQSI